jgi:phosphoglycerate dehydrogenase-like enzyme
MGRKALEPVLALAPKLGWIHSRSAGLDAVTSPALAASSAVMTNGRGVFSRSLAEWAIGALLYFVKDFPRLERNRKRGVWEVFEPDDLAGRTLGIVGYGDIGHAIAGSARPARDAGAGAAQASPRSPAPTPGRSRRCRPPSS